jgi:aryl-alcohol dehydrogenase-like predicted oxidoreductase
LAGQHYGPDDVAVADAVRAVASARRLPPAQVALACVASRPGVVAPIVGVTKPKHLDDALAALGVRLTSDEVGALQAPYRPHRVLGHE